MHFFDVIALIIIILFALKGLKNGLIIELSSLIALLLGIIVAIKFSNVAAAWLSENLTSQYVSVIAFILVFVFTVIVVHIVARIADKLMKAIALGWLNRLAGAVFGILKAAFLISILLILTDAFGLEGKINPTDKEHQSWLYDPIKKFAPSVLHTLNVKSEYLLPRIEDLPALSDF